MGANVTVVGSGVVGLTTAVALREQGHTVRIKTADPPLRTASAVAAALWYPYVVGGYRRRWAAESFHRFRQMETRGWTSIRTLPAVELLDEEAVAALDIASDFWWRELPGIDFRDRPFVPDEFPGLFADGVAEAFVRALSFRVPVIRMPDYLPELQAVFERLGGRLLPERVSDLEAEARGCDFVVNCTGWQARELVQEESPQDIVRPVAGHVVRVARATDHPLVFISRGRFSHEPVYLVPRYGSTRDYVLGGTLVDMSEAADVRGATEASRDAYCDEVLQRCGRYLAPAASGPVADRLVGLRPVRRRIRVEQTGAKLIHCYGHGGAGVTLSWGTAAEVCRLVQSPGPSDARPASSPGA